MQQRSRFIRELVSRRRFLAATAGLAASACARRLPKATDALRVAAIGIGGRGWNDLEAVDAAGARIVALCDCDRRQTDSAFKAFPDATRYTDWRRLLERESSIDAVIVATPDHSHAAVAMAAMKHGQVTSTAKSRSRTPSRGAGDGAGRHRDRARHADGDTGPCVRGYPPRRRGDSRRRDW